MAGDMPEVVARSNAGKASLIVGAIALAAAIPFGIGGLIASKTAAEPTTVSTTHTVTPSPSVSTSLKEIPKVFGRVTVTRTSTIRSTIPASPTTTVMYSQKRSEGGEIARNLMYTAAGTLAAMGVSFLLISRSRPNVSPKHAAHAGGWDTTGTLWHPTPEQTYAPPPAPEQTYAPPTSQQRPDPAYAQETPHDTSPNPESRREESGDDLSDLY